MPLPNATVQRVELGGVEDDVMPDCAGGLSPVRVTLKDADTGALYVVWMCVDPYAVDPCDPDGLCTALDESFVIVDCGCS